MDDAMSGRVTPTRDVTGKEDDDKPEKIITECVDVYLMMPEGDREIELKDFTIMKPKNNRMHRLVRYYPRCEISYRAVPPPPPEEKVVTSPNGTHTTTITTTHRHNGGFSNPSRNAEVFRLKRKLLKEYYASITKDPTFMSMDDETLDAKGYSGSNGTSGNTNNSLRSTYRRPASPPNWGPSDSRDAPSPPRLSMFPKYRRMPLGDEDSAPLTSHLNPRMSWKARINYISSLWPEIAPVDDDEDIMDYYGLEVQIISEEERKKELEATKAGDAEERRQEEDKQKQIISPVKSEPRENAQDGEDEDSEPEMTVETRSAAKMKDADPKILPVASKQDDWVQCDKCQKWRRLPNHVNVSELPATWYCKMNRWDKRFNKCSAPEEKVVVPMKESDLVAFRERKFVQEFLQRVKRMEKATQQYKYVDSRDDNGERQVVQCVECFKQRPLIGGMDPRRIAQPFVCWMNSWDEMHASCCAPQGPIPSRHCEGLTSTGSNASGNAPGGFNDDTKKYLSGSGSAGTKGTSSGNGGSNGGGKKAPSNSKSATSNGNSKPQAKRRPSDSSVVSEKTGAASTVTQAKKPKRR